MGQAEQYLVVVTAISFSHDHLLRLLWGRNEGVFPHLVILKSTFSICQMGSGIGVDAELMVTFHENTTTSERSVCEYVKLGA